MSVHELHAWYVACDLDASRKCERQCTGRTLEAAKDEPRACGWREIDGGKHGCATCLRPQPGRPRKLR
jgi:hypothetical protein